MIVVNRLAIFLFLDEMTDKTESKRYFKINK